MAAPISSIDEGLKAYGTEYQRTLIDSVNLHGGLVAAARALGIDQGNASKSILMLRAKAARAGYAPGHFEEGVAPGYLMGKVTVQRGPAGAVERTWERQSPDAETRAALLVGAAAALAEDMPRLAPLPPPSFTNAALLNQITITDFHLGMMARAFGERDGDWDLDIAESMLLQVVERVVASAPVASTALFAQLGDFLHFDGLLPVTPMHGHVLDAAGTYQAMVRVAVRALRRVVDLLLMRHERVIVLMAEGNHDLASAVWLQELFAALYEQDPRVTVIRSRLPFYAHQHGKVMLGFSHGHRRKRDQLPILFAAEFPEMWGATTKRYVHCGHEHHVDEKEHAGIKVIQHPTLAARDSHAAWNGWISERELNLITYHTDFGQVGRTTITPEMLAA